MPLTTLAFLQKKGVTTGTQPQTTLRIHLHPDQSILTGTIPYPGITTAHAHRPLLQYDECSFE
ncbi:hypothetical protein OkiPb00243_46630 [Escherichia coli]